MTTITFCFTCSWHDLDIPWIVILEARAAVPVSRKNKTINSIYGKAEGEAVVNLQFVRLFQADIEG